MFDFYLWGVLVICILGFLVAFGTTRDCFHPLVILLPMIVTNYWYTPWTLVKNGSLDAFLDIEQRDFVQTIYFFGVVALLLGCFVGSGLKRVSLGRTHRLTAALSSPTLRSAGYLVGALALAGWSVTIVGVGGIGQAFGRSYGGGWSDYGYLRDAQLALFPAMMMLMPTMMTKKSDLGLKIAVVLFALPSLIQGLLGARRGPTFMLFATLGMAWYLYRNRRPALFHMVVSATCLGYLILFLVANRDSIYIGSSFTGLNYDVVGELTGTLGHTESGSSGNEYVYGAGSILNAEASNHFFWGRRYLAEILVRPVPRQLWPNKYADFGVPELETNAGTGGKIFHETLGWNGAVGSAPGIVADLWIEVRFGAIPAMAMIGWLYGRSWRKAIDKGGFWILQYIVAVVLSLYLVMQTMEAVIFRFLILSVPIWLTWFLMRRSSRRRPVPGQVRVRRLRVA
jgi:hypothetical protein